MHLQDLARTNQETRQNLTLMTEEKRTVLTRSKSSEAIPRTELKAVATKFPSVTSVKKDAQVSKASTRGSAPAALGGGRLLSRLNMANHVLDRSQTAKSTTSSTNRKSTPWEALDIDYVLETIFFRSSQ